jgi:hypothetical protein
MVNNAQGGNMTTNLDNLTVPTAFNPGMEVYDPVNGWAGASSRIYVQVNQIVGGVCQIGHDPTSSGYWMRTLHHGGAWSDWITTAPSLPPLVVSSLNPAEATIGDPDLVMQVVGEGFTADCVITFNGGDEPTNFVSDTVLSTIVRPSTADVAGEYPVTIKRGAEESPPLSFTFNAVGR